ncbi:MAG: hypothetical protein M3122_10130 [Actinomycetota bacterium]|nr:hypothetical protein [Actinomycetota bacterium]
MVVRQEGFQAQAGSQKRPEGPRYKYSYKVKERVPEDRIGVPIPDSGIPREWVGAAREALNNYRRPARVGDREWEL